MGGEQDTTGAQAFYTAVTDKLGSNKLPKTGKWRKGVRAQVCNLHLRRSAYSEGCLTCSSRGMCVCSYQFRSDVASL